jgi:peptide/nickel transport system substrate-binding protein
VTASRREFLRACLVGAAGATTAACESAVRQQQRTAGGTGRGGGVLTIGSLTDLDPTTLYSQSITSMTVGLLVYDTLIRYDHRTLAPQPWAASAWTISPDGRTVTLRLRPGLRFHTGRPLTSDDVAYAVGLYASAAAGSQLRETAARIVWVDTDDPATAVLHLDRPTANLFDLLEFMLLVDHETARGDPSALPAGTGPFTVAGRQIGVRTTLRRNDDHWRGPPRLDGVAIRVVHDRVALLNSVRAGQTDLVLDASPQSLRPFLDRGTYRVESADVDDVAYYVGVNVARGPLADKRVRQAISLSVDRDRLAREVFADRAFASSAPWAKSSPAYRAAAAGHYRRDPALAAALLAAAGARDRPALTLSYPTGLAAAPNIAAVVADNLADAGIPVILDPREQSTFSPFLRSGGAQLWLAPHGFGQVDPLTLATGAAPFRPGDNLSGFASARYTAAVARLAALRGPHDPDADAAYRAFTDILLDDQFVIDLVITSATTVSRAAVRNPTWNMYKYLDAHQVTVR